MLLEGFSNRLLLSLKDVLVERDRLTLGKELGRGQSACLELDNMSTSILDPRVTVPPCFPPYTTASLAGDGWSWSPSFF